ncbi:mucin-13-like isoform X2, partial [Argonauta hians]
RRPLVIKVDFTSLQSSTAVMSSVDGLPTSPSFFFNLFLALYILLSQVRSSEADIVSTSLNFSSSSSSSSSKSFSVPIFFNKTLASRSDKVKTSTRIVVNENNDSIPTFQHDRIHGNDITGIKIHHSSTIPSISSDLLLNNSLSYNGIVSPPLSSVTESLRTVRDAASKTVNSTTRLIIQDVDYSQQACNENTNEGCKVKKFERCSEEGACECLRGYMVSRKTGSCVGVQYFWSNIYIERDPLLKVQLNDWSAGYFKLEKQLKHELLSIFSSQNLPGLLGVQIMHILWKASYVEVNFRVSVEKSLAPSLEDIKKLYDDGLVDTGSNNNTYKYIIWDQLHDSNSKNKISEFNHCLDPEYNYCSLEAVCKHYMKSFQCKCKNGYDDISPDKLRAPGEICIVGCGCQNNGTCDRSKKVNICRCLPSFSGDKCQIKSKDSCHCQNNGTCQINDGVVSCVCPTWFLGEKCEIRGKLLVIILCSTLGAILFLTLLICILCMFVYRRKAKKKAAKSAHSRHLSTSESTLVKLPRLWTESGSQLYEVPVSPDRRRWSFVSDPVRYPEDVFYEDQYRPGTLPLPKLYDTNRRQLMSYPNPSFQSSTLPLRPPYQQDKWRSYYPAPRSVAY